MQNHTSFALTLLTFLVTPAIAEDWPQWRGPNRDAIWDAKGIVDELPPGQLEYQWSVDIGPGYNGPTVADGRVYVMDRHVPPGQLRDQYERVVCFDSETGNELWKHEYAAAYTIDYTAGPRASVTVDGDRVYTIGSMGHFHCLDAASGNVIWSHDLENEYEVNLPIWGITASPLIYKDLVIQQVGGPDACMVAFDKNSGTQVWKSLDEKASYSSPIIIQQAGQDVLVCWTGESLSGLNPMTGKVHWSHSMPPRKMPIGIGTPIVSGELIFVSSFYDGSLMVRAASDSLTSELVWRAIGTSEKPGKTGTREVNLGQGVPEDGAVYGVHAMIGTSIIQDGYIYCVDSYGQFRCLEAKTGKRMWEDLTAVPHNRWATIHMVRQADRVWMFNEAGELMIARLAPTGLSIIQRSQLIEPTKIQLARRDGVCWSHPAFAEQSIFARNDNKLVRVSLKK